MRTPSPASRGAVAPTSADHSLQSYQPRLALCGRCLHGPRNGGPPTTRRSISRWRCPAMTRPTPLGGASWAATSHSSAGFSRPRGKKRGLGRSARRALDETSAHTPGRDEAEIGSAKIRRKSVLAVQHLKAGCAQVLQDEHRIQDVVVHLIGSLLVWCAWCRLGKDEAPAGLQRVVEMSQY